MAQGNPDLHAVPLGELLAAAGRLVEGATAAHAARDRSGADVDAQGLIALHMLGFGPATPAVLAQRCRVEPYAMRRIIERLRRSGFVARDAEGTWLTLTPEGNRAYAVTISDPSTGVYDVLSEVEEPQLFRRQLVSIIDRLAGGPPYAEGPFAEVLPFRPDPPDGDKRLLPEDVPPPGDPAGEGDGESPANAAAVTVPRPIRRGRWLIPALLAIVWLVVGSAAAPVSEKLSSVQENDDSSLVPANTESATVQAIQRRFVEKKILPAVVMYERPTGLAPGDRTVVDADIRAIQRMAHVVDEVPPAELSQDGKALLVLVPLGGSEAAVQESIAAIRDQVKGHPGLPAHVTGPAAYVADLVGALGGIDTMLLLLTLSVVFVILLVVYRSPLLPLLVLGTAGLALTLASAATYYLAREDVIDIDGQSTGILSILVIGACTDYALLLVSRFREELRRHENRFDAIRATVRASLEPIIASGGTVILAVSCLLFSDLNSNRGLGPVAALGIVASLLAALTFLPCLLALFGRAAFWPFRPELGVVPVRNRGIWARIAAVVARRPRLVWIATTLALFLFAGFLPQLKADGLAPTDSFIKKVDSVTGQEVLGRHFPAGGASPAVIIARADHEQEVAAAARSVEGVAALVATGIGGTHLGHGQPSRAEAVHGLVQFHAILSAPADSKAAIETVERLRASMHGVRGAEAKVGGATATRVDKAKSSNRDRLVIIPIVLAVILLVLIALLRALILPVLLLASVVVSFAATLGISAVVFNQVFDFAGSDPATTLFSFIFLVALGVDYNIFLMSRVREESPLAGAREGMLTGLRVTGGVITSAGIVLAATFAALAVLPLVGFVQLAFIVACGVLIDTLIVRSLLVPALVIDIGRFSWWPGMLSRGRS